MGKLIVSAAVLFMLSLGGCIAEEDVQDLRNDVDRLEALISGLEADVDATQDALDTAQAERDALQDRLDEIAAARLRVEYGPLRDNETVNVLVEFDPSFFPSQVAYDAEGATHPDFYSAHDLTVAGLIQSGASFNASYFSFGDAGGFFLDDIDGVSAQGHFWEILVNGNPWDAGMSDVRVLAGDVITWRLTAF